MKEKGRKKTNIQQHRNCERNMKKALEGERERERMHPVNDILIPFYRECVHFFSPLMNLWDRNKKKRWAGVSPLNCFIFDTQLTALCV
jgi:hypothetical protein